MTLPAGSRLGPYELVAPLGAGGMGEVYRATDTHLKRAVAIKVLPESFAGDVDRLARFQREAEVLAALNHPNIAGVYGLEKSGPSTSSGQAGITALVMELVEGDDLSALIARGPMPLADALPIARQIADALDAAHEQGIVHRDLKPANVKVRADGTVKVLDFGLAKSMGPGPEGRSLRENHANSPTLTAHMTEMGMILGTAAYMAPEQAKGRTVDRRADIWAFGVVLYEMLAGRQAFAADSTAEILGAVVLKDPDWSALPATTPARLRDLLLRCLQKDSRVRQRDIGDVKLELDAIASGRDVAAPAVVARTRSPWVMAGVIVAVGVAGVAAGWGLTRQPAATTGATTRFIVDLPGERDIANPVLSPDGRFLVFSSGGRLVKRDLTTFAATPMSGTEGALAPFISPNGRWVGFFANGKIKKVALAGGDARPLGDADADTPGAAWGPGDTILYSPGWATGLFSLPADGGQAQPFTEPDRKNGERGHWTPYVLPGEQRLLFTIWMAGTGPNDARVGLLDLNTRKYRALFPGTNPKYLRSGHVLFFHTGAWHVVPFDAATGTVTGDPVTALDDALGLEPDGGASWHAMWTSDTGTLAYLPGPVRPKRELLWADRKGALESLGLPPRALNSAALSPDGRRIIVGRLEGGIYELWMNDVLRKTEDRLDFRGSNTHAIWHPGGEELAFVSTRKGDYDAYAASADGSRERPLLVDDYDEAPAAWTRDGRFIMREWRLDGSRPVELFGSTPGKPIQTLIPGTIGTRFVSLSPDERWLAYESDTSGRIEVYVQPFPGSTPGVRISRGGTEPMWSRTGHEIFFRKDDELVSVSYRVEGGRFVPGSPTSLFELHSFVLYGVAPDGRFLLGRRAEPEPPPGIRVVLNWFEELKARGPVK